MSPARTTTESARRPTRLKVTLASAAICGVLGGVMLGALPASAAVRSSGPATLATASVASGSDRPCLCPVVGASPSLLPGLFIPAGQNAAHAVRTTAHTRTGAVHRTRSRPARAAKGHAARHYRGRGAHGKAYARTALRRAARLARRATPYLIYDSVTPSAIPLHHMIATYATGGYAVPGSAVAGRNVVWIDTQATDPSAQALDVEPGDATPSQAATWVSQRLTAHPHSLAIVYTMQSDWPATQAAVGTLPPWMRAKVRWWIADPTGYPHVLPGSDATQWYWGQNYDISTATPRF